MLRTRWFSAHSLVIDCRRQWVSLEVPTCEPTTTSPKKTECLDAGAGVPCVYPESHGLVYHFFPEKVPNAKGGYYTIDKVRLPILGGVSFRRQDRSWLLWVSLKNEYQFLHNTRLYQPAWMWKTHHKNLSFSYAFPMFCDSHLSASLPHG
jgi:hypothetical protein